MKLIRSILAAALVTSSLAACDMHADSTQDVYFSGVHGKSQTFCSPQQRHTRTCY